MTFTIKRRNCTAIPYSVTWTVSGVKYEQVFNTVQACMDYAKCIDRKPRIIDRTGTVDRWSKAVATIGTARMLELPQAVKDVLAGCDEIDTKVLLLETIVAAL